MDAATITVVKDGRFFGHPQSDMGNVGLYPVQRLRVVVEMRPLLILGAILSVLVVACGSPEPEVPEGMPMQNEDGTWTPEFKLVTDSMGEIAGVARNEDIHGDIEVYPIPVYTLEDQGVRVGWMDASGYWPLGEERPRCRDCFSVSKEWGKGTKYTELSLDDGTTVTLEEERMSALAIAIMAFTMFMIFMAFVLVGTLVARKADEVALKMAGYITAVVFALMAAIVPFLLFFMVYTYDTLVIHTQNGEEITITGWSEEAGRFSR